MLLVAVVAIAGCSGAPNILPGGGDATATPASPPTDASVTSQPTTTDAPAGTDQPTQQLSTPTPGPAGTMSPAESNTPGDDAPASGAPATAAPGADIADLDACDLINTTTLNAELNTAFDKMEKPPFGNSCEWSEPLYEDWTKQTIAIVIWSDQSAPIVEAQMEANPSWQVQLPLPPAVDAAYFDTGGAGNPTYLELDDGSVFIGAYSNFTFKTAGTWIGLQPAGALALADHLEARLLDVARRIAENIGAN